MSDYLIHAKPIKDITKQGIQNINKYFKNNFAKDTYLKNIPKAKTLAESKNIIKNARKHISNMKTKSSTYNNIYSRADDALYKKFSLQYLNKIGHLNSGFKMLHSRFINSGTTSYNQPINFLKRNLDTSLIGMKHFMSTEDKFSRHFARNLYSQRRHPTLYKRQISHQLQDIQWRAIHQPWHVGQVPRKMFQYDRPAMRILGIEDQHYYNNAIEKDTGKNPHGIKGLYHIKDTSFTDLTGNPKKDILTPIDVAKTAEDYQRSQLPLSQGEDLKDNYLWNTKKMQNTTSEDWRITSYSKYAHPYKTLNQEYQKLVNVPSFNQYLEINPRYTQKLNIFSSRQMKQRLLNSYHHYQHDDANWSKDFINKFKKLANHVKPNRVYTGESVTTNVEDFQPMTKLGLENTVYSYEPHDKKLHQAFQQSYGNNLGNFLNKYPKFANKMHMHSGDQALKALQHLITDKQADIENGEYEELGLNQDALKSVKQYKQKYNDIKPSKVYLDKNIYSSEKAHYVSRQDFVNKLKPIIKKYNPYNRLYNGLKTEMHSDYGEYFNKFPKLANQLKIHSGSQIKRRLHNSITFDKSLHLQNKDIKHDIKKNSNILKHVKSTRAYSDDNPTHTLSKKYLLTRVDNLRHSVQHQTKVRQTFSRLNIVMPSHNALKQYRHVDKQHHIKHINAQKQHVSNRKQISKLNHNNLTL